jgi:hypothetical protein
MSALIIWLNSQEAKLFHLRPQSIHVENVSFKGHLHPVESLGLNHPKTQTDEEVFYRQLSAKLEKDPSNKWLLMGPGIAVKHFKRHLETHHPLLNSKVIGIEKVDHLPDSDLLSVGRQFLHKYYLFQGVN